MPTGIYPHPTGNKSSHWKGGRHDDGYGYILICKPDHPFSDSRGYVREHRLVYEEYYKCIILPWVDVHHINNNRQDNRVENLQLLPHSIHGYISAKKDMSDWFCSSCGDKTYVNNNGYEHWQYLDNKRVCNRCYNRKYREKYKYKWRKGGVYYKW